MITNMIQENKELLLKDLCARLPYGVKCKWEHEYNGKTYTGGGVLCDIDHVKTPNGYRYWDCYFEDEGDDIPIELIKPYLRPMSSMIEEEIVELKWLNEKCDAMPTFEYVHVENYRIYDWMNRHHFDFHNLIEKGLALEASKNMYKF